MTQETNKPIKEIVYFGTYAGLTREFKTQQEAIAYSNGETLIERDHETLKGVLHS